jgi:hypothetical protein
MWTAKAGQLLLDCVIFLFAHTIILDGKYFVRSVMEEKLVENNPDS